MTEVQKQLATLNIKCTLRYNEPMKYHTSFKIGGPAEVFAKPGDIDELKQILAFCLKQKINYFALGQGANILVSDLGIKGVVISLAAINSTEIKDTLVLSAAGIKLSDVAEQAFKAGLGGLDTFYKMPGSVGGAIYMNARCYGTSIADILEYVEIMDENLEIKTVKISKKDFGYKLSPFQKQRFILLGGAFRLHKVSIQKIRNNMQKIEADRRKKGHFIYPCAGSVFKNNREWGMPTGKIIDTLGLKGFSIGGAKISEYHANIIVNTGTANAREVKLLIEHIKSEVSAKYGYILEPEILYVGE